MVPENRQVREVQAQLFKLRGCWSCSSPGCLDLVLWIYSPTTDGNVPLAVFQTSPLRADRLDARVWPDLTPGARAGSEAGVAATAILPISLGFVWRGARGASDLRGTIDSAYAGLQGLPG